MKLETENEELEIANTDAGCTPFCLRYLEASKRAFPDIDERLLTKIVKGIFRNLSSASETVAPPDTVITPAPSFPKTEFKHPVHREWTDADFERLWRFDETEGTEAWPWRTKTEWSHPAHTKSVIPPASQTGVVWHEMGFYISDSVRRERWDVPPNQRRLGLSFHHIDNAAKLTDIPSVLRCQEPGYLSLGSTREDVRLETENSREFVKALIEMYEQDWQTQAERESLLRQLRIKKSKCPDFQSGERIRTCLTERFVKNLPPLKVDRRFRIAEFSGLVGELEIELEKLKGEWEEKLRLYDLQEIELPARAQQQREWSENDEEDVSDVFEGLRIINDGVRQTTEVVSERKELFHRWRVEFNPDGLSAEELDMPKSDYDLEKFKTATAEYLTTLSNVPLAEAIAQTGLDVTPAALVKRFGRKGKEKAAPEWSKVTGHYFCVVHLNGQDEIKILAPLDAPFGQACDVFMKKMRRSKLSAAKEEGRKKDKTNLAKRIQAASDRIQQAYGESFIYRADPAFWKPPEGGVVTYSPTSRGETYGE